jgi:hypothetical protein
MERVTEESLPDAGRENDGRQCEPEHGIVPDATLEASDVLPGTELEVEGPGSRVPRGVTSRRVGVWLSVFSFLCFAYFLPHWDWNQTARLDMTVAAANHHTFAIDRYQGNTGDKAFFRGHYYIVKAPGQSLIGVPIYLGYRIFMDAKGTPHADTADDLAMQYVQILITCAIPATLLLLLFFWFLGYFSNSLANRALLTLALGLGTNIFAYAQQLFGHVPAAALLFAGFVLVYILGRKDSVRGPWTAWLVANPDFTALLAGLALGTAILVEFPPAFISVCIGVYALLRVPLRHIPYMVVGAFPPLAMLMGYNYAVYGNPFTLAYTSGAAGAFTGALSPGFAGVVWPPKWDAIDGLSFSPYRGLFFLSPFLLLAFPGYRLWRQRGAGEWVLFLVIPVLYFFIMTMYTVWSGGLTVGPRFLIPMLPFLALPAIFVLDSVSRLPGRDIVRGLVYILVGVSIFNTWIETITGTSILFPPENNYNPLFTANLPELGRGEIWTNRGMDLGLTGLASLLPLALLLIVWSMAVFAPPGTRRRIWGRVSFTSEPRTTSTSPSSEPNSIQDVFVRGTSFRELALSASHMVLIPSLIYFASFCVLTWPAIQLFSTHILGDEGDGLQNMWNIWWVNKSITQLHTLPWYTSYLHYPYGTTLLGHAMSPLDGFMGIALLRFLSLVQTYNVVVIFSYVVAGLTTFWLAFYFTRSYPASIIAGYLFSFSNYHVVHTQGHLNLVSLEWIPLFVFLYWMLLNRPSVAVAIGASICLLLVLLCDYYYYLYCVMAGALLLGWRAYEMRRTPRATIKPALLPAAVFVSLTAVLTGPLTIAALISNYNDPFIGNHDPSSFSLDLLSPFTPDLWWRFKSWMPSTWIDGANIEQVAYVGFAVTVMLVYVILKRRRVRQAHVELWAVVALVFWLLSLGPTLHIAGQVKVLPIPLPYTLFGDIFPPLSVGGVPSRMIVMTTLSLAVIFGTGLTILARSWRGRRIAIPLFLALVVIEYLPGGLPESQMATPGHIQALLSLHDRDPVVDMVDGPFLSLYYQTLTDRPIAFGYLSRIPTSVNAKDNLLTDRVMEMRTDILYKQYGFRYLMVPAATSFPFEPVVYQDANVRVQRLGSESRRVRVETIVPFVSADDSLRELLPNSIVGQTFTAAYDGLRGVGFVLSRNNQTPTGSLVFHLQDASQSGRGRDLATTAVSSSALADGYLKVFTFPPIRRSHGHKYYAYLEASGGTPAQSMWVWGTASTAYHGGTLMLNHKPALGNLITQLFYPQRQS